MGVYPATLSDDGKTVVYDLDAGVGRELEPELCLRGLLDLDSDNPSDLVAFVGRHGAIQRPWRNFGEPVIGWARHDRIGVQDLRVWLATAQDLARSWVAYQEGGDLGDQMSQAVSAAWREGFLDLATKLEVSEAVAWQTLFPILLNIGLREYHIRVEYTFGDDDDGFDIGFAIPDLFCALCFQVHQLIVEDAPIRRCKLCGRAFSRQIEGRAQYGQHRTVGVSFCTWACANTQSSRDYRRRRRKEGKK